MEQTLCLYPSELTLGAATKRPNKDDDDDDWDDDDDDSDEDDEY